MVVGIGCWERCLVFWTRWLRMYSSSEIWCVGLSSENDGEVSDAAATYTPAEEF